MLFPVSSSFVKVALTKNPKKRPAAERMLFHPFVLAGDLTLRLSVDLLDKVRNPPGPGNLGASGSSALLGSDHSSSVGDDDEEATAAAPRRISSRTPRSKKTQSEMNSELGNFYRTC